MTVTTIPSASYRKVVEISDLRLCVDADGNIPTGYINAITDTLEDRCFSILRGRDETKKAALRMVERGISTLNNPRNLGEGNFSVVARVFADFKALRFRVEFFLLVPSKDPDEDNEEYRLFITVFLFQNVTPKKFMEAVPVKRPGLPDIDQTFFPRKLHHAATRAL